MIATVQFANPNLKGSVYSSPLMVGLRFLFLWVSL